MANRKKEKKKGVNLLGLIFVVIIIVIAIIFITRNLSKEDKTVENENNNQVQTNTSEKYVRILEDGTKLNTSEKLKETKKLDDLEMYDIQLTYKDGVTNVLATVKNTTGQKSQTQDVEITLLDEDGDTIYKMQGIIEGIDAGAIRKFNCSVTADFANVYDLKVNIK